MKNITLLFPGQGSQYVGMGKEISQELYLKADSILNYKLSSIILEGPEDQLKLTQNTQPALLAYSLSLLNKLMPLLIEKNITIDRVLGHSVGEYAALVCAGVMSFEDAVMAVHLRGKYMQEAVPVGLGQMIAILKLDASWIEKACEAASTENSKVMPANYNDPKQIVISGDKEACSRAVQWLNDNCPEKFGAITLQVSAPFHSSLMKDATLKMKPVLDKINFTQNKINYVANIDAKEYNVGTDSNIIRNNLLHQIEGSVRWTQSIQSLPSNTLFLEVGPQKVLTGLIKRILPEAICLPMDVETSWPTLQELLS